MPRNTQATSEVSTAGSGKLNLFAYLVAGAAIVIVFKLNYNWIIVHFYKSGAYLYDSGALANVIWHNSFNGTLPPTVWDGRVFNGLHFTPLNNLADLVSYAVPLGFVEFYAVFEGLIYATLPFVMFMFLYSVLAPGCRRPVWIILAGLLAFIFAFNGFTLITISYPHPEMLWVSMAFGFFFCLFAERTIAAAIFFAAALSVREDAGFQLFGFLALTILLDRLRGVPFRRQYPALAFAVAGFAYTVVALAIQKYVFDDGGLFATEFIGADPYARLTSVYFLQRLAQCLDRSPWIWSTFAVAAVFALINRRPAYLLGYVATVPWIVLYLFAPPDYILENYRAFPIALAMVWPMLEIGRAHKFNFQLNPWLRVCGFLAATVVASAIWFQPRAEEFLDHFKGYRPDRSSFAALTRFLDTPAELTRHGVTVFDDSVISIWPRRIPPQNSRLVSHKRIDTFFFWRNNHFQGQLNATILAEQDFAHSYDLKGTNVRVASRFDLSSAPVIGPFLRPSCNLQDRGVRVASWVRIENCRILIPAHTKGIAVFGPYVALQPGRYEASYDIELPQRETAAKLIAEVTAKNGARVLATRAVTLSSGDARKRVQLKFGIADSSAGKGVEFRVHALGDGVIVNNVSVSADK